MSVLDFFVGCLFIYSTVAMFFHWWPFISSIGKDGVAPRPIQLAGSESQINFMVVISCFNGAGCLPEIIGCLKRQRYPSHLFRILVLADNCEDDSIQVARSLSVEIYERRSPLIGKGNALNELLGSKLRNEPFDALVLFDVDAQINDDFLARASQYLEEGKSVLQGKTEVLNGKASPMAELGGLIQALLRSYQRGRALAGWTPLLIGSHGILMSREAINKLQWRFTTAKTGDDLEMAVRLALIDVPVEYAPDLVVINDVPETGGAVQRQRRRWTYSSMELGPIYSWPLLKKVFNGSFRSLDILLCHIWGPSFSVFYLFLLSFCATLGLLRIFDFVSTIILIGALALFIFHNMFLFLSLKREKHDIRWAHFGTAIKYLAHRLIAFFETVFLGLKRGWYPTAHTPRR